MEEKMFLITSIVQLWLKVTLQHQSRMESIEVLAICQIRQSQVKLWFGNRFVKLRQVWLHLLIAVKHQYEPHLRVRGRKPHRASSPKSVRNPHVGGRRRPATTNITRRGKGHHQGIPIQQGPTTGWYHLPRSQTRPQEIRRAYDKHMQRHASPAMLPILMEVSGCGHDPQALTVQLAAELPTYQLSPSHG
ncbi:hypothetical protein Trydic_g9852 [Trypoxylus dichotomus]